MPSVDYELRYLQAGISILEDYILSNDMYWPVGVRAESGNPPYPRLTLGGMLFARKKAQARPLNVAQRNELGNIEAQMDELQNRWRVAWENKAIAEFHSRLQLWNNFWEDFRDNPDANVDRYNYEVNRRVQLELLSDTADNIPQAELNMLKGLDGKLHAVLVPSDFIWEPELASSFPPDKYWYLYGWIRIR
jgi:hypothetical protein